jgi:hypothetical protein
MSDNVEMWQVMLQYLDHNMAQARTAMMLHGGATNVGGRRNMMRRSGVAPRTPAMPASGGAAASQ